MNIESLFYSSFNKFCFLTSSLLRLGMLVLFKSVSSFPFDEGSEAFIVDKNQFVRWVEHVVSEIFVVPHFSNEVLCHRLPKTLPPLHEVFVISPLSRLVNSDWFVGDFHKRHPISFNPFSRAISSFCFGVSRISNGVKSS